MNEFAVWWLALAATGIAAFPLCFVFFRWLPDRGFTLSKVVGLLLLAYGFWMGSVLGLLPASRGSVILILVLIAGVSWAAAARHRAEIVEYVRSGWRYMLLVELMFLGVLAAAVYLRSFAPEIDSGEKPFELAFLNAIDRAGTFPPEDPWLAGENISYYYFGYTMIAALTKLVALKTSVTFFLGVSTVAALTWVAVFGLVYNLVLVARGRIRLPAPHLSARAVLFGVVAAILVLVVSNLEGVFELMARYGVGGDGFYGLVGIFGLQGPYDCAANAADCEEWYPTRHIWWWWATRIGSAADIQEFPFFSLHFGDLHAHVLAMPFLVTLFSLVFQTTLAARDDGADRALNVGWIVRHPGRWLLIVLLVGAIAFTDAWAIPLAIALMIAAALLSNWLAGASLIRTVVDSATFVVPLAVVAFVLYLPFYLDFEADREGLAITQVTSSPAGNPPENSESTRPLHFLLFWTPILLAPLTLAGVTLWRARNEVSNWRLLALAALPWLIPLVVWIIWAMINDGLGAPLDEIQERAENLITLAFLIASITAVALLFLRAVERTAPSTDQTRPFLWMIVLFALTMLFGAELFYVNDTFDWRANTVFRFWHQAWIILGIAGAFALYRLTSNWALPEVRVRSIPIRRVAAAGIVVGLAYTAFVAIDPWDTLYERWWTATPGLIVAGLSLLGFAIAASLEGTTFRAAWPRLLGVGVAAIVFGAALVYPVLVTFDRTGGFTNDQTMDGLDFLRRSDPLEHEAIEWLNDNVSGTPVILEAFGPDFSDSARVSSRTGLPTVIGWLNHERQWRGDPDPLDLSETPFTSRPLEVARLYSTPVWDEAQFFIEKYDIEYVYVGRVERELYNLEGLLKFREFMDVVFDNGGVTIYRVRDSGEVVAADSSR